ncbi:hypothetical protein AAHA92_28704 [Salvia divinorum]|uniref:Uncharacterized protein n=1 Tax=Salvia divinorum TaxID=28513 RepID=A0ABD1FYE1_SALDI
MASSNLADQFEYYVRFEGRIPSTKFISSKDMNGVLERAICLLEERLKIDRMKDYGVVPSRCIMVYTETIRAIISILKVVCASDDTDYRIMHIQRLEIEHMNARTVLSKIEKYGYVFKMMRLVYLLLFGVIVILPTVIALKNPNDEFAEFFKNTGPFLFTISFALLEMYVRKNLLDLHEIQKTIIWSRRAIQFTQPLVVESDRKSSTQIPETIRITIPKEIEGPRKKKRERAGDSLKRMVEEMEKKSRERALEALELQEAAEKQKHIHHLVQLQEEGVDKEKKWRPCCDINLYEASEIAFEANERASSAFRENDFLTAYNNWSQAIQFGPHSSSFRSNRSQCLINLGCPALALADAKVAIVLAEIKSSEDDLAFARYHEGAALHRLEKFGDAANAYVEAIKLKPNDELLLYSLNNAICEVFKLKPDDNGLLSILKEAELLDGLGAKKIF